MSARRSISETLADPSRGRWAVLVILALLSWLAMMLRLGLDFDGVLDTDVLNFGLAGFRFDVLDHQPHPPGYPGYVLLLKTVHLLAPWLDPIALAKWTTRLCGTAITFAAYWACFEALGGGPRARGRALWAATLAVFHPILWFYGGDGQSHGAEALLTLVLLAVCLRVQRRPTRLRLLLLVALFGLAGSIRPTIPLLASPLLLWLFWRRPVVDWLLAAAVGVASVLAWYAPLVVLSGGFELHRRASKALVTDMFVASYSVFGERANLRGFAANLASTGWAFLFSIVPIIALGHARRAVEQPWVRVAIAIVIFNIVFFTLMFTAEFGYLIQIAALSILVPATWPEKRERSTTLRLAAVIVICPTLLFAGPATVPVPYSFDQLTPTYPRVISQAEEQRVYREVMCGAAEGEPTLLVTDNYSTTNSRWLTMVCKNVVVALFLHDFPLNPKMDNWLVFFPDHMDSIPPDVPLEPGPAATYTMAPVARVVVSLDSTPELKAAMEQIASCPATRYAPYGDDFSMAAWPASCFDRLRLGANTVIIQSSGAPRFGDEYRADPR